MTKQPIRQAIRSDYSTGLYSYSALARKYGLNRETVSKIIKGPYTQKSHAKIWIILPIEAVVILYLFFISLLQEGKIVTM